MSLSQCRAPVNAQEDNDIRMVELGKTSPSQSVAYEFYWQFCYIGLYGKYCNKSITKNLSTNLLPFSLLPLIPNAKWNMTLVIPRVHYFSSLLFRLIRMTSLTVTSFLQLVSKPLTFTTFVHLMKLTLQAKCCLLINNYGLLYVLFQT